jgi:heme oxygenase (mycobilin-producing)
MAAKVLIKRRFKKEATREILTILNDLRTSARRQEGYISGETLRDPAELQTLLVIGTWKNLDCWLRWKKNRDREQFEAMLSIYQVGPTKYEEYLSENA